MGRIGLLEDMGNNTITGRVVLTSGVQECTESYVFFVRVRGVCVACLFVCVSSHTRSVSKGGLYNKLGRPP